MIDPDAPEKEPWHLDKRVNVAHITATLALAATFGAYLVKQESRIVVLEEHRNGQMSRDMRQDQDMRDIKSDISLAFREIRDEIRALRDDLSKARRAAEGGR
jgi:hypothetical protein